MDKKIIGTSAVAIIGALGIAAPAGAQNIGGMPSLGSPVTSGGQTRQIDISASVGVRHDSNIARTSAAIAAARGISRSDEKLMPNINVNIGLPFGAHSFSLSGSAGYEFHRKNTRLDRERIQFGSSLAMNLPVCDPTFNGDISRRQSDLGERAIDPNAPPTSIKNTETLLNVGTTVACGKDFGLRPTVSVSYQDGSNSDTLRKIRNKTVWMYSGGLGYVHPSIGDILLFVQQRDTRFPNQILPDGRESGNRVRSYGGSFSRNIGARLQGSVQVTYTDVKSRQTGVSAFHGLNWSGDLTAQMSPSLILHANVGRSISSSLAVDANYHVDTNYGLDANYAISPLMSLQVGASLSKRRFLGSQTPGVPAIDQLNNDSRKNFFGSLTYQFAPKLRFMLDAAHERRSANGTVFDYHNNRIGLRAELSL